MARKPMTTDHEWVGASTNRLDQRNASIANRHGRVRVDVDTVIEILDVYCRLCRRTYDDVAGQPCETAKGNEHLIGGPLRTRRKRLHDHDCVLYGCLLTPAEADSLRRAAANPPRGRVG